MPKKSQKTQKDFKHTWFIQEWAALANFTQADAQRKLGWSKAKASDIWNGQQYTQSVLDDLAPELNARPWELLLHPRDAFAIRSMREDAARIAASRELEPPAPAAIPARKRAAS